MMQGVNSLISALREELGEYGEMLMRLERHQELVIQRASNDLLQSAASVEEQADTMRAARTRREEKQAALASDLGLATEAGFSEIIPRLPGDYNVLVSALVDENNALVARIKQRARQNHLLLMRSVELMQQFMSKIFGGSDNPVYTEAGTLPRLLGSQSLYEAVG